MADINEWIQEALVREGACLLEQAKQMRPIMVDDCLDATLSYAAFTEYGKRPDDLANTIDSTAIVIDENVKALPAPQSETHS